MSFTVRVRRSLLVGFATVLAGIFALIIPISTQAQVAGSPSPSAQTTVRPSIRVIPLTTREATVAAAATQAAEATAEASLATPSAAIQNKIQEKKDSDITETTGKQKGKLAAYLDTVNPGPLSWNNFLQHAIRNAVKNGVPANILVIVLLFPLVASLIGASRHIIGLRGFGIYIPAVLSVALVSTGIVEGLIIFGLIVGTALVTQRLIKKAKLAYLPRTALLLWTISLGLLALILAAPFLNLVTVMSVNIFPILILVLLSENFLDSLQSTKPADAIALIAETLGLAFITSLLIQAEFVQKIALSQPELLILTTGAINLLVGKFTGLRLTELLRFRSIIEE